ncbi:hypothetical protein ACFWPV_01075 [Streptomyces uncialis]|uniref:hypothetical protein n=1 Tax=Streptomyces uncialis TaxID=1048205 RepID=UPI00365873EA
MHFTGDGPMIGSLITAGPGTYRPRVHARGRDTAIDLTPDDITEHYHGVGPATRPPRQLGQDSVRALIGARPSPPARGYLKLDDISPLTGRYQVPWQ